MKLTRLSGRSPRPGTILPMLGVCLIGLFGFVALAVDLGMLAVSRTQSQNGADVAALVGTRTLNNKDGVAFNNLPAAVAAVKTSATSSPHLSANLTAAQITKIESNQYLYNTASQRFEAVEANWVNVTGGGAMAAPNGGSWTAMRVTVSVAQPTYFMRVFGVTSMPSGARATAVFRPRDIAFVLDMTGSMAFSSQYNTTSVSQANVRSMNPDPAVPRAGHYASVQAALVATQNEANGSGEAIQRNNYTIATPGGPPIVRNFRFDPANVNSPATSAFPLTALSATEADVRNAFHRWNPPELTAGNSDMYIAPTHRWDDYNPDHNGTEANPRGPTPAPDFYGTMTDGVVPYRGDRWRRGDGAINKTQTSWATNSRTTRAAYHAADLLGYVNGADVPTLPTGPTVNPAFNTNAADRYVGYSMGPGYWGKTFFMWPPDPRWAVSPLGVPTAAPSVTSPDPNRPSFDTNGRAMCDWRRRFFLNTTGGALDPQGDNNPGNNGSNDSINEAVLNTAGGHTFAATARVNYAAVLRWLKTGPQTLPPNLRAGRVLFYSSIPDDVTGGTGQVALDQAFWRAYIDFVLGTGNYTGGTNMAGLADSWGASPQATTANDLLPYRFAWEPGDSRPYMRYTDSPLRPRMHTWFGPLSMLDFIGAVNGNWMPGTAYEAQSWQLKAGVNAVLDDVKNNHPNDYAGMVMFALSHHNGVRVPMGQNFKRLKNALFYPRSLLNVIDGGDVTTEYRPYNATLGGYNRAEIPNSDGQTDPATGLAYAFNMLSSSTIGGAPAGTGGGRRGAQKIVIFETDGVPNNFRPPTPNLRGFNTYYTLGAATNNRGNGDTENMDHTKNVVRQIVKLTANTATTGATVGDDSGLSLPNAPARVYPIAFGDLFDEQLAPNATFRNTAKTFLRECGELGNTAGLPDTQIITGPYQQRITRLRDCLERIFQGGVSVVLVE